MKYLKLASLSIALAVLTVLSARFISIKMTESAENKKVSEIGAIITSEVQTGSMAKATESAKALFNLAFPGPLPIVQIKEQNRAYGSEPSSSDLNRYRSIQFEIEARSDIAVTFYVQRAKILDASFVPSIFISGLIYFVLLALFGWIAKRISMAAQKRFNTELQQALGLSIESTANSRLGHFFEKIVNGSSGGQNLKKSIQHLKQKIVEQNQLSLMTEIELKKNEKFIEVVRQVRHDIRSPLQTLIVLAEDDQASVALKRHMTPVISSINNLIEDLEIKEEMADSSELGLKLHIAEALIKEVIQQRRLIYGTTQIELKIKSDFLTVVQVNPHHFRRVIGNLIQNAQDAILAKGIYGQILIETFQQNGNLRISIKDNGIGISSDIKSKLFIPGFTHGKNGGSGLGLSHAKSCIHRWKGEISITSNSDGGATVSISLPQFLPHARYIASPPLKDPRVSVVVDDDPLDFARVQEAIKGPSIYCSSIQDFENWLDSVPDKQGIQMIFDYNLGEDRTGLDILETLPLDQPRVLSTNDYDDPRVVSASTEGIYILPKVFLS